MFKKYGTTTMYSRTFPLSENYYQIKNQKPPSDLAYIGYLYAIDTSSYIQKFTAPDAASATDLQATEAEDVISVAAIGFNSIFFVIVCNSRVLNRD